MRDFYIGVIRYSFYTLFFLVPLVLTNGTSELFELNKMWLTFALTIVVGTAWLCNMIGEKRFYVQRTPIDLPLLLFVLAHIISTLFSLDMRVSLWGYYSRFNGGLLSIVSYVLLYYAFVSHLHKEDVKRVLYISLITGLLVGLWGLPSHFGHDLTCLAFRGTFDVSCWTEAFKPTIRMFSTLGQPAWLAAYMAVLLPIAMSKTLHFKFKNATLDYSSLSAISYMLLAGLFYLCLLYANTRAGFLGFWIGNIVFWTVLWMQHLSQQKRYILTALFGINIIVIGAAVYTSMYTVFWFGSVIIYLLSLLALHQKYIQQFVLVNTLFFLLTFFNSTPFSDISNYFSPTSISSITAEKSITTPTTPVASTPEQLPALEGGTESGSIRKIVWKGAVDAWKANPWVGTGVETFAFAYYQYRPAEHNMTSEWDYLYNKAHNEYLNYLTTTGIFGLGSYIAFIALFLFYAAKLFITKKEDHVIWNPFVIALVSGYVTILVTNFFGFSVVIMNLYLFLIPAWFFMTTEIINPVHVFSYPQPKPVEQKKKFATTSDELSGTQWVLIIITWVVAFFMLLALLRYYVADTKYALGFNLFRAGQYEAAYEELVKAVEQRPNEPVFKDELSVVSGALASAYYLSKDQFPESEQAQVMTRSQELMQQAIQLSDQVTDQHPNVVTYWKTRTRLFYSLSQMDPHFLTLARNAVERAHALAPTDAKVAYNYGLLLGQTGDYEKGITVLERTVAMKADYRDAYFALGLFYRELATDDKGNVTNTTYQEKAVATMRHILQKINAKDDQTIKTLKTWNVTP